MSDWGKSYLVILMRRQSAPVVLEMANASPLERGLKTTGEYWLDAFRIALESDEDDTTVSIPKRGVFRAADIASVYLSPEPPELGVNLRAALRSPLFRR